MPTENAKESLRERPIGSVVIEYELIVFHVLRQLPIRHQAVPFGFGLVSRLLLLLLLILVVVGDMIMRNIKIIIIN